MEESNTKTKVLDCKASDNVYMHKDFHGGLCYSIKYVDEVYGEDATKDFLMQVGHTYFAPLSERLKSEGLKALEQHWRKTFTDEGGSFDLRYADGTLVLEVQKCPAVAHLKECNQFVTERFCETTVVVNEAICRSAGYECSCTYEPGKGQCVQKFWKAGG